MELIPSRFLFRVAHVCRFIKGIPLENSDHLLDLPEACRIDNFAEMEDRTNFADVRVAWNDFGMAVQAEIKRKKEPPQGNAARLRSSDGVAIWLDTRDARSSHRASRFCH